MKRLWILTVLLAGLFPDGNDAQQTRGVSPVVAEDRLEPGRYHALLIAVEEYDDPAVRDLSFPVQDVERVERVLVERYTFEGENVHVLTNPDRQAIFKSLEELGRLPETDNLLIFYAGHGYWDEGREQGYWLPSDARQDNRSNWISNSDIQDYLRGFGTKHTLLISDACFSGGIFKTRNPFYEERSFRALYELPSRKAMTSGVLKVVPDKSAFVEYLVKRLEENTRPYVRALDLHNRMFDAVVNNSPNTPQYGTVYDTGDEGGDFIFIRRGAPRAESTAPAPPPSSGAGSARRDVRPDRLPNAGDLRIAPRTGLRFRYIPAGSFLMGSPNDEPGRDSDETQHRVTLTREFWMAETEVTQGQWKRLMRANPSRFKDCGDDCPVENVSWYDVVEFANRLSREEGVQECYQIRATDVTFTQECTGFRLPTEAEWEYAARAGMTTRWSFGDAESELADYAWVGANSGLRPNPVGQKKPNPWGLLDVHGNVSEWCSDWFALYPDGDATDPAGPMNGSSRVLRGGAFNSYYPDALRGAFRGYHSPDYEGDGVGFRVAWSAAGGQED